MSSGAEHYRIAEALLDKAVEADHLEIINGLVAQAQAHATLALASATAYPAVRDYLGDEAVDARLWTQVTA